jgi:putative proteasome-type protease
MIYSAGNFIECTTDTPYLQIGEHKYGKPVLDRAIGIDSDLYDSLKIGLNFPCRTKAKYFVCA